MSTLMHALDAFATWLYANVLGNLVASVIWALPALWWHHTRIRRHVSAELRHLASRVYPDERTSKHP